MELKERCRKFIDELGVKATKFADNAGIGRSTYYKWLNDKIEISNNLENRIDEYLKKYGF